MIVNPTEARRHLQHPVHPADYSTPVSGAYGI